MFILSKTSIPALGPIYEPSLQWVPETLSLRIRRPAREAYHPLPTSAGVKHQFHYIYLVPVYSVMACAVEYLTFIV